LQRRIEAEKANSKASRELNKTQRANENVTVDLRNTIRIRNTKPTRNIRK
jgi:hypothetical protein